MKITILLLLVGFVALALAKPQYHIPRDTMQFQPIDIDFHLTYDDPSNPGGVNWNQFNFGK